MKFLDITLKDLTQLFKDWQPAVFLLAAPIVFTLMFGFMFGGFAGPGGKDQDNRLPIGVINEEETIITNSIIYYFKNSKIIQIDEQTKEMSLSELKQAVADGDLAAGILFNAGFSQSVREKGTVFLDVILDEHTTTGMSVLQSIQPAANRVETAAKSASLAVELYSEKVGFSNASERQALYDSAFQKSLEAWQSPPVTTLNSQTQPVETSDTSEENAFAQSLPGMMAQFAIAGLIGAAEIIVQERKSGSLNRLLSTAVPKFEILAGHWLAMFVMIFIQFVILVIFGALFLRLYFFNAPLATLALSIASCAFVASLGLLIGILAKMPEQTAIYALIPMFIFAGLGGAWMPIDLLGETVQKVSKLTPVSWIMTGFKDILLRGAGLPQIARNLIVLIGFSLLFFIPAAVMFYRKQT